MTFLLMVGLMVPILSGMAVTEFLNGKTKREDFLKALKYSFYGVGGLTLFFALFGGALFDFVASIDETLQKNGWPVDVLREDRARSSNRCFTLLCLCSDRCCHPLFSG
jgi:hypothetical protein